MDSTTPAVGHPRQVGSRERIDRRFSGRRTSYLGPNHAGEVQWASVSPSLHFVGWDMVLNTCTNGSSCHSAGMGLQLEAATWAGPFHGWGDRVSISALATTALDVSGTRFRIAQLGEAIGVIEVTSLFPGSRLEPLSSLGSMVGQPLPGNSGRTITFLSRARTKHIFIFLVACLCHWQVFASVRGRSEASEEGQTSRSKIAYLLYGKQHVQPPM